MTNAQTPLQYHLLFQPLFLQSLAISLCCVTYTLHAPLPHTFLEMHSFSGRWWDAMHQLIVYIHALYEHRECARRNFTKCPTKPNQYGTFCLPYVLLRLMYIYTTNLRQFSRRSILANTPYICPKTDWTKCILIFQSHTVINIFLLINHAYDVICSRVESVRRVQCVIARLINNLRKLYLWVMSSMDAAAAWCVREIYTKPHHNQYGLELRLFGPRNLYGFDVTLRYGYFIW